MTPNNQKSTQVKKIGCDYGVGVAVVLSQIPPEEPRVFVRWLEPTDNIIAGWYLHNELEIIVEQESQ